MRDYMVRASAADAQVRAFACTTRETVEAARKAHGSSPVVTAALGRLLSAGAMMGSMLKGSRDILTLQIRGDGPVRGLTVTADSRGRVKGYPEVPDVILPANSAGKLDVGGAVGKGTLSVGLGVLMERNNTVRQAGGFLLQLMPFAAEEVIDRLEQNLKGIRSVTAMLDEGKSPEQMLELLLEGLEPKMAETQPVVFACDCNREKIEKVLISLGSDELEDMIREGKAIQVNCSFCNSSYSFGVDELEKLYDRSRGA